MSQASTYIGVRLPHLLMGNATSESMPFMENDISRTLAGIYSQPSFCCFIGFYNSFQFSSGELCLPSRSRHPAASDCSWWGKGGSTSLHGERGIRGGGRVPWRSPGALTEAPGSPRPPCPWLGPRGSCQPCCSHILLIITDCSQSVLFWFSFSYSSTSSPQIKVIMVNYNLWRN